MSCVHPVHVQVCWLVSDMYIPEQTIDQANADWCARRACAALRCHLE
jgi:hypothetical protein